MTRNRPTPPSARPPAALARVAGALLLAVLGAACRTDPPTVTPVPPTSDPFARVTPSPEARALSVEVTTSVIGPGFDRFAFIVRDEQGEPIENGTATTTFYREGVGGMQRMASGPAILFGRGLAGGGRWVTYTDFDVSGPWSVDVTIHPIDGSQGIARADFRVAGRTTLPSSKQPPPTGDTPVIVDDADLATITTDPNPVKDFYVQKVSSAVLFGKSTVVQFSSPGRCTDPICREALDPLKRAKTGWDIQVNFIHIESRDPDDPTQLSETAKAWGLTTDPWTFVFDRQGFLYGRVEGMVSVDELNLLINKAQGGT